MKKLWIALICAAVMTLCLCAVAGAEVSCQFDSATGKLTISGDGEVTYIDVGRACDFSNASITSVEIVQGVTSIGESAFSSCTNLQSITIPNSVTSIGYSAFHNCTSLSSISIPNSVTSIGDSAFYYCTRLSSISIPNSVTNIGEDAFSECSSLQDITIPDSVTSIGKYAFANCSGLQSITLSNSVSSIEEYAFYSCISLQSITIPDSVTSIGEYAFSFCSSLQDITIPDSVTSIDGCAFFACTSLSSITIPNSVTSIGEGAFTGCSGLQSISVDDRNNKYSSENGVLFNKNKTTLIAYPYGNTHSDYSIPNSVTSIGISSFYNCTHLRYVSIPNSVTSIDRGAFDSCFLLSSITIPNSVTRIGQGAFNYCTSLQSITILNSAATIGEISLDNCSSLGSITIPCNFDKSGFSNSGIIVNGDQYRVRGTSKTGTFTYIHDWSYTASGETITAACGINSCPNGYDTTGITLTLTAPADLTWSGSAKKATISGYPATAPGGLEAKPTITYYKSKGSGSTEPDGTALSGAPSEVGNYVARMTWGEKTASLAFSITKAVPTISAPSISAITYGQTLSASTLSGGEATVGEVQVPGTFSWKDGAIKPAVSDSETTEYTMVFTPTDTSNCKAVETAAKLGVNPKEVTASVTAVNRDYEAGNKEVFLTAGTVNGVEAGDTVTVDVSAAKGEMADDTAGNDKDVAVTGAKLGGTDAGNYKLAAQPDGVTVTISKIPDPAAITDTAVVTVGGNTVDLSKKVTGAAGTVTYTFDGDAKGCTLDKKGVLTSGSKAGTCKVKVTITESENHTGKTGTVTVTVTDKKTADLKVTQAGAVYGEKLADPDYTLPSKPVKDAVVSYSGTTEAGAAYGPDIKKPTEAGSYTVSITEETIDTIYTGSAKFTISKAKPKVTAPKAKEGLTETGKAQELVTAGSTDGGEMQYALGKDGKTAPSSGWGKAVPAADKAGTYCVWYRVTGDANHLDVKPVCITVKIAGKKTAQLKVTQADVVYGGKLADPSWTRPKKPVKDAVVSYSGTTAAGAAYGPDSKKPTEAGSYTVSVTEETLDTVYTGSAKFTISKAEPKVTAPKAKEGLVENGKAQELVTAGSADGGEMQYALGKDGKTAPSSGWGTAVPTADKAGTYYVWYKVTGDANHLDTKPACVTVVVEEKKPEKKEKVTLKKIKISKTESLSNHKIRVSWKKLDKAARKKAKMIEIQLCPDDKFEKNVITKKVKSTETSAVIKNLVKGKRYYVRIRVYTQKGNIKYVSKWSDPKTCRIIKTFKK